MQTKANEGIGAIRVRAALLLLASLAGLVVPLMWRPATASGMPGDPTGLVVVAAAWAAWALTIYLAVGVGIAALGHLGGPRCLHRFAPSALRRLVEVAVGASSAAALCLVPAAAYADSPSPAPAASASPLDWPGLAPAPTSQTAPAAAPHPHPAHRVSRPAQPVQLVVRPGDSLWSLAARQLGPRASAARIAATWPRLYAANRRTIGANPDLIHPGQRLVPPTSEEGTSR